jgi:hypothetical protein
LFLLSVTPMHQVSAGVCCVTVLYPPPPHTQCHTQHTLGPGVTPYPPPCQSNVWATFSPMEGPVKDLYGWSSATVDILAAWGPLIYLPASFFCPRLVERVGLRATITLGITLVFTGTVLRSLTTRAPYAVILAHTGQIFNALAGPLGACRCRRRAGKGCAV